MYKMYQSLSDRNKGILLVLAGSVLLLHTIGIIETGLNYLIIAGSLFTIWCGFTKMGGIQQVQKLLNRNPLNNNNSENQPFN